MPRIGSGIALVGREDELTGLRAALATAVDGRAGAVLVAGDAGVGKTRLLSELVAAARSGGTTVFTGRCLDVDKAGLPYLPFVEALGQLTVPQRALAARRSVLHRLMPGVAADEESSDPAMEQLRLFDAVHGLFTDLAEQAPVLLAIEDLHWADASTRDLILFLVSRLDTQRILIVGTYRVDDLHRRHPLRPLLVELSRLSAVEHLELGPFDYADAVCMVDALADGALPPATVHEIAERSEGNAFFCEELTAAYGDGAGIPAGLADLLLARVERLSGNARRVVRAAAVANRTVTHASLAAVSELPDDVLEEALRESVQHNVLVTPDGGYNFRHALLCEAVYDDLLPGERVRLHAGYARVVTTHAMRAHHSFCSHDLPGALVASVRAAEEAGKMGALGEKLRHVEQALELWSVVPDPEQSGTTELTLLCWAARAAMASGELERAEEYAKAAVAEADKLDDPEKQAETRYLMALASIGLEDRGPEIQVLVEEAWALLRDRPVSVIKAKVQALAARSWVWSADDDLDHMRTWAERAVRDAKAVGAAAVEVDALVTLAVFAEWSGNVEEAIRMGWAAADRAASIGAFDVEIRARKNAAVTLWIHGRKPEGMHAMDDVARRSAEVGLEWSLAGIDARCERVSMRYHLGDWAGALEAGRDFHGAPTVARTRVTATTLWVLAGQGDFAALDQTAEDLAAQTEDALAHEVANLGMAEAALWRGRPRDAVGHIEVVVGHMESLVRASITDAVLSACFGLWALCDIAEQARRRGDQAETDAAVAEGENLVRRIDALMPKQNNGRRAVKEAHPEVLVFQARLDAEQSRLRGEHDRSLWEEAVGPSVQIEYHRAVARWRWATLLLTDGDRDSATEQLSLAYEVADRLGARPLREAVVELARRSRISLPGLLPIAEPSSDLTPRELAVLQLVASGMTNRQVGEQLYISQKTASVHLSRAMAKLGAGNRTEVVSIAHDRGLIGEHQR
nr:helix-turn-helix transcriptional regulator [Kibdelosporangium sp. MJ126-NF4]CTQ95581.1 LuxR-family transcriptional regulator [Kibdelosporangium sp. MJ126-NF4]